MPGPIHHNFDEVARLSQQHQTLVSALQDVFHDLITKAGNTADEGWNTAAAAVFLEKQGAWDKAAKDWADSQTGLANVIGRHNVDVQDTDNGPASNVLKIIDI